MSRIKGFSNRTASNRTRSRRRSSSSQTRTSRASSKSLAARHAEASSTSPACTSCVGIPITSGSSFSLHPSRLAEALNRCLAENEAQCPNCARTHGVIREIRKNNEQYASRHDLFAAEVEESDEGFITIAGAFGKGVMGFVGEEEA